MVFEASISGFGSGQSSRQQGCHIPPPIGNESNSHGIGANPVQNTVRFEENLTVGTVTHLQQFRRVSSTIGEIPQCENSTYDLPCNIVCVCRRVILCNVGMNGAQIVPCAYGELDIKSHQACAALTPNSAITSSIGIVSPASISFSVSARTLSNTWVSCIISS